MNKIERKDVVLLPIVTLLGLGICYSTFIWSDSDILWDNSLYFNIGIPMMLAISGIIGFVRPGKALLWGIGLAGSQPFILAMNDIAGQSVIDELILFGIIGLLSIIAAFVAGGLRLAAKRMN